MAKFRILTQSGLKTINVEGEPSPETLNEIRQDVYNSFGEPTIPQTLGQTAKNIGSNLVKVVQPADTVGGVLAQSMPIVNVGKLLGTTITEPVQGAIAGANIVPNAVALAKGLPTDFAPGRGMVAATSGEMNIPEALSRSLTGVTGAEQQAQIESVNPVLRALPRSLKPNLGGIYEGVIAAVADPTNLIPTGWAAKGANKLVAARAAKAAEEAAIQTGLKEIFSRPQLPAPGNAAIPLGVPPTLPPQMPTAVTAPIPKATSYVSSFDPARPEDLIEYAMRPRVLPQPGGVYARPPQYGDEFFPLREYKVKPRNPFPTAGEISQPPSRRFTSKAPAGRALPLEFYPKGREVPGNILPGGLTPQETVLRVNQANVMNAGNTPPPVNPAFSKQVLARPGELPAQMPTAPAVSGANNVAAGASETVTDKARAAWERANQKLDAAFAAEMSAKQAQGKKVNTQELRARFVDKQLPALYQQELRDAGVPNIQTNEEISKWMNTLNAASKFQGSTGEDVGGWAQRLVEKSNQHSWETKRLAEAADFETPMQGLKKLGVSNQDMTYLLHYFESTPEGVRFNPSPAKLEGKYDIPAFDASRINPNKLAKATPYLQQLRQNMDTLYNIGNAEGNVGYLSRYVPIMGKFRGATGATENLATPSIFQARKTGERIADATEEDFGKLVDRYRRQVARRIYEPVIEEAVDLKLRLKARGMDQASDWVDKTTRNAMGMRGDANKVTAEYLFNASQPEIDKLLENLEPSIAKQIWQRLNGSLYKAVVGLNPKSHLLQQTQMFVTGALETGGNKNIIKGAASRAFDKGTKDAIAAVKNRLYPAHFDPQELGDVGTGSKVVNKVFNILDFPADFATGRRGLKPLQKTTGMGMLESGDRLQREVVFATARKNFLKTPESKIIKTLQDDLLPGEVQVVLDALRTKGKEAAAREYGVIKSFKAMDIFSRANKPEVLRGGIGDAINFTTYWRGRVNDLVSSLQNKQYKKVGKQGAQQAANAIASYLIVSRLTGDKDKGIEAAKTMVPVLSAASATRMQPAPLASRLAQTFLEETGQTSSNVIKGSPLPKELYKQTKKQLFRTLPLPRAWDVIFNEGKNQAGAKKRSRAKMQ